MALNTGGGLVSMVVLPAWGQRRRPLSSPSPRRMQRPRAIGGEQMKTAAATAECPDRRGGPLRSALMAQDQEVAARAPSAYRKVAEDVKAAIAAGEYAAGARLPSESELAERYPVARGPIRQAFGALRADGIIASRRGARRVVIGGPRVQSFGELLSFSPWGRARGRGPAGRAA